MITLFLDRHDFVSAVEGFAHGSHLRQHVWREIVFKSIPQMSEDEMDFFWFIFRRDLFGNYFYEANGKHLTHVGAEDYLHALAALHRGNRSYVRFKSDVDGKTHKVLCYTFQSELRPLYVDGGHDLQSFDAFIPGEWVLKQKVVPMRANEYVPDNRQDWWEDLSIYNEDIKKISFIKK